MLLIEFGAGWLYVRLGKRDYFVGAIARRRRALS